MYNLRISESQKCSRKLLLTAALVIGTPFVTDEANATKITKHNISKVGDSATCGTPGGSWFKSCKPSTIKLSSNNQCQLTAGCRQWIPVRTERQRGHYRYNKTSYTWLAGSVPNLQNINGVLTVE